MAEWLDETDNFSTAKLIAYPEVLVASRSSEPMRPINLEINPVNICNQSCTWCTYGYLHERRERLEAEQIIGLLDDAKAMGVQSVTWTGGGEPTVYRDLDRVVAHAASLGFKQGINTNGTRVSEALLDLLVGHFSYVRFSIDAGSPDVYARTHRVKPEDLGPVLANVKRITAARDAAGSSLVVGYSFLVDESNIDDVVEGAHRAREAGVDYLQLKPIVHYARSNEQFAHESELRGQLDAALPAVVEALGDAVQLRFLNHKFTDLAEQDSAYGRTYDVCRGNELLATVGADGSVDVCCAYKGEADWSFGNLHDERFQAIWDGAQRRRVLAKIDVHQCPPLCKAHELNKIVHFVNRFDAHKEFP